MNKSREVLIACGSIRPELAGVHKENPHLEIRYLDQNLHLTPKKMKEMIQPEIDQASGYARHIVLGYALCSNGVVGLQARTQALIIPRCHDCIGFFLGSHETYMQAFEKRPGTYYLTPGWIEAKKDPLGIVEQDYAPRLGWDTAVWAMNEELKHYTHIVFINTALCDAAPLRARAMKNAAFFDKEYEEIAGKSLRYFKKLVCGPYTDEAFVILKPGETLDQKMFFRDHSAGGVKKC
jgi:hypothetical protein